MKLGRVLLTAAMVQAALTSGAAEAQEWTFQGAWAQNLSAGVVFVCYNNNCTNNDQLQANAATVLNGASVFWLDADGVHRWPYTELWGGNSFCYIQPANGAGARWQCEEHAAGRSGEPSAAVRDALRTVARETAARKPKRVEFPDGKIPARLEELMQQAGQARTGAPPAR